MINGKIQNSSLCWFDEPRTRYQHDFWLFQLSTATFASWANRVNSECWLSPSFLFYRSTYVRLGTYPQWCIDPQLSQALLLGVFLWGRSYIRFSFSLSHFLFLFCHIHIYCNLCLSVSAVSFPSQHLHFSTHFLPHSQTWSLGGSSLMFFLELLWHCFFWNSPSTFSSRGHPFLWDGGWRCWDPAWHRSARTSTSGESGPTEQRIYLPSSALCFFRARAKCDLLFRSVQLDSIHLRNQGYYTAQKSSPLVKQIMKSPQFLRFSEKIRDSFVFLINNIT